MHLCRACDRPRRVRLFLFAYVTLLLSLSSLWIAAGVWTSNDIFVNNRNYPGGPLAYFLATQNLPPNVIVRVALFTVTFLSDLLVVSKIEWLLSAQCFDPVDLALALLGRLGL